jgi:putative multiple sugar transport system substrate-binding protein
MKKDMVFGKKAFMAVLIVIVMIVGILPYCQKDAAAATKGYLMLVEENDGSWSEYGGCIEVNAKNKLMVSASETAEKIGITYKKKNSNIFTISNGKKKITYTIDSAKYKYYNGSKTITKKAAFKSYVSMVNKTNLVEYSTLASLVYVKLYSLEKANDYQKAGYSGVLCFSKYHKITGLPETGAGQYIGISLPTKSGERWIKDGATMKKILEAKGYTVDLQYAENDIPTQKTQIESMITKGAKVLVIAAIDGSTLSDTLDTAAADGVKLISYDRLLVNTDAVSYYATFDNRRVGQLQAESLLEGMKKLKGEGPYNIELFAGSPDDTNSFYFFAGAMDILQPLIDDGTVVIPSGQVTQKEVGTSGWDGAVAQARMDAILASNYKDGKTLHGVLAPYDGISRGIISSLTAFGLTGKDIPVVTGQDAEAASVKLIVSGDQYSTILKDTRELAKVAANMVDAVLTGKKPEINDTKTYYNNAIIVPSYLLEPFVVTKDNYQKLVINSGYLTKDDIK